MGRVGFARRTAPALFLWASVFYLPDAPDLPDAPGSFAQPSDPVARDLASSDPGVRLRAVESLKEAANPDAALPLARLVTDPRDDIQLAAIAAELNIFLAERIVPRKRIGGVVEVRRQILAEPAFSAGPSAIGGRDVPIEVLNALHAAWRDDNPRVAIEALYAFGALAGGPSGDERRELLRAIGPDAAALVGASDRALRFAAIRVMGRTFAPRAGDPPIEPTVGDAVIAALNDSDRPVKIAAMRALGAVRYERAVDSLTKLFEYYGRGDAAEAALDALARIAHPSSVTLFAAQLAGRSPALRVAAIDGLAREGDPSRLDQIKAAAGADRDEGVALAAAFAAALLADGPLDALVQAAAKPKSEARDYLVELAPGRAERFARYAADPDERIRLAVVDALGVSRDPAAIAIVEPLVTDPSPRVARAAGLAVERLRTARR